MQAKILNFISNQSIPAYELCDALNWNRNKISDVKKGRSRFSVDDVFELAQYFHCSIDDMLGNNPSKEVVGSFNNVNNNNNSNILIGTKKEDTVCLLGDIEKEILSICSKLNMKTKTKLLMTCYNMLEKEGDDNE